MRKKLIVFNRVIALLMMLLFFLSVNCKKSEEVKKTVVPVVPKVKVNGLEIRTGLPNFFAKIQRGDNLKVAYLGGSITSQAGWRVYSLKWLQERFPNAKFSEINAAIGGTASDFGVYRLRDHVLSSNPDLVFVEFAVNDNWSATETIKRSMEGIVRLIWQQNSNIDICFIYTIMESFLEKEMAGQLPVSATVMETVAASYGIPTINFGAEVSRKVKENQLVFKGTGFAINGVPVFSSDGTHPYIETGHLIYQEILRGSFEAMLDSIPGSLQAHSLPVPLAADIIPKAGMVDFTKAVLSSNWEIFNTVDRIPTFSYIRFLPNFAKAGQTGETLKIRFKGKAVGVFDIVGPDAGRVIVEIDGVVRNTIFRFDEMCNYYRPNYFIIDKLSDTIHDVTFSVLSDPFDKAAILQKNGLTMANPNDYKNYNWYVGKILIDGELLL